MSTFSQQQLDQINELLGQRLSPLQRQPVGYGNTRYDTSDQPRSGARAIYGYDDNGNGIFDPNDPRLGTPQARFTGNTNQLQGDSADLADSARYENILGIYRNAQQGAARQLDQTGQEFANAHADVGRGFANARQELATSGQSARRDLQGREQQQLAGAASGAARRGLFNTTALDNQQRAVRADTGRNLSSLYENLGAQRSGLAAQEGNALAGARTNLANFMQQRAGTESGLALAQAEPVQRRSDLYSALQMARLQGAQNSGGGGGGSGAVIGGILGGLGGLLSHI